MELARTLCASGSPINKSQLARALGIARSNLYVQLKRPKMDKALAVQIEHWHEQDDTMGHRKLAVLLATGKNRVKRVMRKYGITARRKQKKYVYPGKAAQIAPNLLRERKEVEVPEVIFSAIFEVRLAGWLTGARLFCPVQANTAACRYGFRLSYARRPGHRADPDDDVRCPWQHLAQ